MTLSGADRRSPAAEGTQNPPPWSGPVGRRECTWRPWQVVVVGLAYAYLIWLPIGYRSNGGGSPSGMGMMGWPFLSIPTTIVLSLAAFAAGALIMKSRERFAMLPFFVLGMALCMVEAYQVYRQ